MKSCEIYRELNQKFGLNINTLRNWIAAIKSEDSEYAKKHLGSQYMNHWYENKSRRDRRISNEPEKPNKKAHLRKQKTNLVRKSECLEYICERVRERKRFTEILKGIQEKYGSEDFVRGTIETWISSIKSSNRDRALRSLGRSWVSYWDAIHHHRGGRSQHANLKRNVPQKQETTARRSSRIRQVKSDNIEIKSELIEFDSHASSSMEESHRRLFKKFEPKKVPEKILGMVKLNGRDYFLIKSKGFFKDNLGI